MATTLNPAVEKTQWEKVRWFYSFLPHKMGAGSTLSLLPLFITDVLGANVAVVGIASALSSAAAVPAAWFWGWLSDRFGSRRSYLTLGFLGFALPTLLMAFSRDVATFVLLVVAAAALGMAATPVSSTLIMDSLPRGNWDEAFGRFNQIGGWALVAGRIFGFLWMTYAVLWWGNEFAQRNLWLIGGGLGLLSVAGAWWMTPVLNRRRLPERLHSAEIVGKTGFSLVERPRYQPNSLHHLPTLNPLRLVRQLAAASVPAGIRDINRPLLFYYLISFLLFTASVMAYTPFAVWQRQELGNTPGHVFLVGMINSIAAAFSYRWVGGAIRRRDSLIVQAATLTLRVMVFGGFAAISLLGLRGTGSLAILIFLQALSGLSWAGIAVAGHITVAHLAPRGREGAAVGAYNSFIGLGAILGALVSGYIVLWLGYGLAFAVGAGGIGLTVLMLLLVRRWARVNHDITP